MPITNSNLMAIRIPIDADHHRSEATLVDRFLVNYLFKVNLIYFSHGISFEDNFMGIMNQAVEDGIGDGRVADSLMPMVDRELTGEDS